MSLESGHQKHIPNNEGNAMNQERKIAKLAEALFNCIDAHGESGCSVKELQGIYGNYTWQELNSALFDLLRLEDIKIALVYGEYVAKSTAFGR